MPRLLGIGNHLKGPSWSLDHLSVEVCWRSWLLLAGKKTASNHLDQWSSKPSIDFTEDLVPTIPIETSIHGQIRLFSYRLGLSRLNSVVSEAPSQVSASIQFLWSRDTIVSSISLLNMADEGSCDESNNAAHEYDESTLSDIDDDHSFDDGDDITTPDADDCDDSSNGIHSADLNRDDRFQLSWGNASWTLTETMDTDYFFLVPPTRDLHMSRSSSPRRQFVLPSSAVRRSGENTFPISPPTRITLEGGTLVSASVDEKSQSDARDHRNFEASLSPRTPVSTQLATSSPTGVATYSLNHSNTGREQTSNTIPPNKSSTPTPAKLHPPLSPTFKKRVVSRQDSLTYSIGQSVGHSTGASSFMAERSSKTTPTSGDNDEGDSSLFRNLYEDDDQSLFLDEDCFTECADPHYKSNRAFITSAEAQNASMISRSHEMSPILKLLKTLTNFCHPNRKPRHKISSKPLKNSSKHRKIKSDPELLTDMLEDRLIMTKKTVETAPWEHLRHEDDTGQENITSPAAPATNGNGPPVIIKFRPSQLTSSCIQELAFQIDSRAEFVLDDSRSLPDSLYQPTFDD